MTKKEKALLNISLVPLVVIIAVILGAGYLLLKGEVKLPSFNKGPQIRRLQGFPTIVYTDKAMEKQRLVIKSQQEISDFLNQVDGTGMLILRDNINFSKEFLLAISTSSNSDTGHSIKIKKVYEDKASKKLIVMVEETESGKNCKTDPDKNIAVDVAAITKTDWEISFDKIKKTVPCEEESTESSGATDTTKSE